MAKRGLGYRIGVVCCHLIFWLCVGGSAILDLLGR